MPRVLIVDDNAELLGLLSTVFEDAGYTVSQAQRGKTALEKAKAEKPDVALVDVLLPDVMGYEIASLLRQLRIPFVLVSGVFKGGKHGLDAVQRHGAADYFEKPFQVDRLVERIASIVPPNARHAPVQEAEPDDEIDVDVEDSEARPLELTGRVSVTESSGRVSATLQGERIRVEPPRVTARPVPPRTAPPPVVAPVAPTPSAPGIAAAPTRTGPLTDNLPQLVSAFWLAQETGELVLQRGAVRKTVYFERGAPVFAVSNLSTDRFGQFLVRIGKVPADELKAAALVAERTKRRTGDVLIEMGLLNESERMYYVGQQVKAIIYSLFAWEDGTWSLAFRRRAREEMLKLDLHPANLIMRGVKKLYSPTRLARLMPDSVLPIPAQDPSYLLSDVELESWEAMLLARVDGTRTVRSLIDVAQKPPESVRGLLVGLQSLKILGVER